MADGAKPSRLTIDGVEQLYYSDLSCKGASGDKAMETIPLGLAGHSDGASMMEVSGTSLVPDTGFEFDFQAAMDNHRTTNVGYRLAGRAREYRGRFLTVEVGNKVGDNVTVQWAFQGRKVR